MKVQTPLLILFVTLAIPQLASAGGFVGFADINMGQESYEGGSSDIDIKLKEACNKDYPHSVPANADQILEGSITNLPAKAPHNIAAACQVSPGVSTATDCADGDYRYGIPDGKALPFNGLKKMHIHRAYPGNSVAMCLEGSGECKDVWNPAPCAKQKAIGNCGLANIKQQCAKTCDLCNENNNCCSEHIAECLACKDGISVQEYCKKMFLSNVPGCTDASTARPLMTSARPLMTTGAIAAANDTQSHEGCAMSYMGKCSAFLPTDKPDNLIEEVGHIESVQVCQHICKELYPDWCTWFIYDRTTNDCKIFSGSIDSFREDCQELGYQKEPSFEHCDVVYEPEEKNACYNFREDYCRYDGSLLDTLEKIETLSKCQMACQFINGCTYFQYDKQEKICKLHTDLVATRVCDMVHGTPEPDFQTCLDNGNVPWDADHA